MKFNEKAFANTLAVFVSVVYLFCRLGIALFPQFSMTIARSWFHGFDMERFWAPRAFAEDFILGLVTAAFFSWIAGWLFASFYNYFSKR